MSINVPIVSEWNDRGLRRASTDLESFSNKARRQFDGLAAFGRKAATAFAGLAVAGVALGKNLADAASDYAEAQSKVGVVLGDAADQVERFADSAASIGIARTDALEAASTFAIFGKSAGLAGNDLANFSTDFVQLAADLASFNNTTPEEAITAIGAGLRGESEPLRRFGVLLNDAALRARALELGIYDGNGALTAQEKILAAQAEIWAQTGDAQGDFARTSDGLANQQRLLSARLANLRTELGLKLLPAFTKFAGFVVDRLYPAVDRFARYALGRLTDAFNTARPFLETVGNILRDNVGPIVERIVRFMDENGTVVGTFFAVLAGAATIASIGALVTALSRLITPVTVVIGAFAALAAAAVYAYQNFEWFRGAVDAVARFFSETLPRYFRLALSGIQEALDEIIPKIVRAWDTFYGILLAIGRTFVGLFKVLWNLFLEDLVGMLQRQFGGLVKIFEGIWKIIYGVWMFFTGLLTGDWSRMWAGIQSIASGAFQVLVGLFEFFTAPIIFLWNVFTNTLALDWGLMWALIEEAANGASRVLGGIFNTIRTIITTIWDNTIGRIITGVNNIINSVNGAIDRIKVLAGMQIPGASLIGGVVGGIGNLGGRIIGALPFAEGGIVTAPTLGLVGEAGPEAIIPLDRLGQMGGITVNVAGTVITERDLVEQIRVGLLRAQRSGRQLVA